MMRESRRGVEVDQAAKADERLLIKTLSAGCAEGQLWTNEGEGRAGANVQCKSDLGYLLIFCIFFQLLVLLLLPLPYFCPRRFLIRTRRASANQQCR